MTTKSINCIVETPKGYGAKYNYDARLACIELSKVLPAGLVFPFDFGLIPGTVGEDGDPLDVIIISEVPSFPGCAVKCRIIGGIKAAQREREGNEMRNDRYIGIPAVSVMYKAVSRVSQLPPEVLDQLQHFFINYNQPAGKKFKPLAIMDARQAINIIHQAQYKAAPTQLVQLLLPLYNSEGTPFPEKFYAAVKDKFIKEFGGVTMYAQSPASGLWKHKKKVVKDENIVFETMVAGIDRSFWKRYKEACKRNLSRTK